MDCFNWFLGAAACVVLAWALAQTSTSPLHNVPLAALLLAGAWLTQSWVRSQTHGGAQRPQPRPWRRQAAHLLPGRDRSSVLPPRPEAGSPGWGEGRRSPGSHARNADSERAPPDAREPPPLSPAGLPPHPPASHPAPGSQRRPPGVGWRERVGSAVVSSAWEMLCSCIVEEFIYDMWYAALTPDREFPAGVRDVLNDVFGELAHRARGVDLRLLLNDACELLMEQLELFRDTRESIRRSACPDAEGASRSKGDLGVRSSVRGPPIVAAAGENKCGGSPARHPPLSQPSPETAPHLPADPWRDLAAAARERALQREMRAEGCLHPALAAPGGHHRLLSLLSDELLERLLPDPRLVGSGATRAVVRELVAGVVLRPVMMLATPYTANKALYSLLARGAQRRNEAQVLAELGEGEIKGDAVARSGEDLLATPQLAQARKAQARGAWEFEQKLLRTAALEEAASSKRGGRPRGAAAAARSTSLPVPVAPPLPPLPREAKAPCAGALEKLGDCEAHGATAGEAAELEAGAPQAINVEPEASSSAAETEAASLTRLALPAGIKGLLSSWTTPSSGSVKDSDGWEQIDDAVAALAREADPGSEKSVSAPTEPATGASFSTPNPPRPAPLKLSASMPSSPGSAPSTAAPSPDWGAPVRVRVVAADLIRLPSGKEVVAYVVRVSEGGAEWSVARRYRHFEVLHRQLRAYDAYGALKLPPKRVFGAVHGQDAAFVERRRRALDAYAQRLAAVEGLRGCSDLAEFFRPGSEVYECVGRRGREEEGAGKGGGGGRRSRSLERATAKEGEEGPWSRAHASVDSSSLAGTFLATTAALAVPPPASLALIVPAPASLASALPASSPAPAIPPPPATPSKPDPPLKTPAQLLSEASAGVSLPLYELVDCVFQMQRRGFFRRNVLAVARQVLSLVAGDTIDVLVLRQLRQARQEHHLSRLLSLLREQLWPGGVWFQLTPQYVENQRRGPPPPVPGPGNLRGRPPPMEPDMYLVPGGPTPLDEEEVREALRQALLTQVPAPIVSLLGRSAYEQGVEDVFHMLQSPTFVLQLAYGLLEIALLHLLPELRPLFRKLEQGQLL